MFLYLVAVRAGSKMRIMSRRKHLDSGFANRDDATDITGVSVASVSTLDATKRTPNQRYPSVLIYLINRRVDG